MNAASNDNNREYVAPPSMAPQIFSYQKQYYLFVFLGVVLCAVITIVHVAIFGDPKFGGANPITALIVLLSMILVFFRSKVTSSYNHLKNNLVPYIGKPPSDYATILSVARTINDPKIAISAKRFQTYQLLGAVVAGYFVALIVPLFIFAVMKR